jgi:hypothetical protein
VRQAGATVEASRNKEMENSGSLPHEITAECKSFMTHKKTMMVIGEAGFIKVH